MDTIQIHPCAVDYIRKRRIHWFLGQEQIQMPILIASLGPKRKMIELFQEISMMKNSRTGEDLYTMVNSIHRTSRRKQRQRRHATSMQDLPSLMAFLQKEIKRYPSYSHSSYPVLFQKINIMKNSRTGQDIYIMFNPFTDPKGEYKDIGDTI